MKSSESLAYDRGGQFPLAWSGRQSGCTPSSRVAWSSRGATAGSPISVSNVRSTVPWKSLDKMSSSPNSSSSVASMKARKAFRCRWGSLGSMVARLAAREATFDEPPLVRWVSRAVVPVPRPARAAPLPTPRMLCRSTAMALCRGGIPWTMFVPALLRVAGLCPTGLYWRLRLEDGIAP